MSKNMLLLFYIAFLCSCNGQKPVDKETGNKSKAISNEKVKVFLREENFDILKTADVVVLYDINKKLIEGTTDEYSNKIVLNDTLGNEKAIGLLALLKNDASYDWKSNKGLTEFNPTRQFLIKSKKGRVILLIDDRQHTIGFINLGGQKITKLSRRLTGYIESL